jgi:hypothetical protein
MQRSPPYSAYSDSSADYVYKLLFCDWPADLKEQHGERPVQWQITLFSEPANLPGLQFLAAVVSQEGRVRCLAYSRLRQLGPTVQPRQLLGVIIEVPLSGGLDVLAAYSEGGVRHLEQSGKLALFEGVDSLLPLVRNFFVASSAVVEQIGATDKPRRRPPSGYNVFVSVLVSDGLYFGEGPMFAMQRDPLSGAVIQSGVELLRASVALVPKT